MILGIKDFSHDADGHGDVVYGDHVLHPLPYQDDVVRDKQHKQLMIKWKH